MRDVFSFYPRLLVFSTLLAGFLLIVALMPPMGEASATAVSDVVQTSATDISQKLEAGDCRVDQYAYAPTCMMRGRVVRVIGF